MSDTNLIPRTLFRCSLDVKIYICLSRSTLTQQKDIKYEEWQGPFWAGGKNQQVIFM